MSQFLFGSGSLWGIPLTTIGGTAVSNPTPVRFGIMQDVSVDISLTTRELYGTFQWPVAIGRGKGKISVKAKFAQINAALYNSCFFGQSGSPSSGETLIAEDEAGTIPGTPYQVTVSHSATFTLDLGVRYSLTGLPLTEVASAPATGQYSFSAGVYTFAAADTTLGVLISYEYTATGGYNMVIANQLMGNIATFRAVLKGLFSGKQVIWDFYSCVSDKLNMSTKLDDFSIPEIDFSVFSNAANNLGLLSTNE